MAVLALEAVLFDQPAVLVVALGVALVEAQLPRLGPGALAARLLGAPPPRPRRGVALVAATALAAAVVLHLLGAQAPALALALAGGLIALAAALRPGRMARVRTR